MKILPNLLTVDSDRANFPLHGANFPQLYFLYNPTKLKMPLRAPWILWILWIAKPRSRFNLFI